MGLFMRSNKMLNLGNLEYDIDRKVVVFRITNAFDREAYDKDIVAPQWFIPLLPNLTASCPTS